MLTITIIQIGFKLYYFQICMVELLHLYSKFKREVCY